MTAPELPHAPEADAVGAPVEHPVRPLPEPPCVLGKPDGYYLISEKGGDDWCLVYLYAHADFDGVRHLAFGPQDGSALLPVWDLRHDTVLLPATVQRGSAPTTLADLRSLPAA